MRDKTLKRSTAVKTAARPAAMRDDRLRQLFQRSRKFILIASAALLVVGLWTWKMEGGITTAIFDILMLALAGLLIFLLSAKDKIGKISIEHAALEERFGYRADILDVITASEPRAVVLADKWERILFANREAARRVGRDSESLIGNTLASVFGETAARSIKERLHTALKSHAPVINIANEGSGLLPRVIQTSFVPIADTDHIKGAVLITETDITSIVAEREQRERMLRQLLDVCVALVDRRDPFAAGHSALVGSVARAVAEQMKLDVQARDTAEISGLLMNFGKVLVPQEILTKESALTPAELKLVRDRMMSSADVLSIVQFELPVVDTLRQVHEHVDGSGQPEGKRGEDIIITARICAAVNTFVALISSRAHRAGMSLERAFDILDKDTGSLYDAQIVRAIKATVESGRIQTELNTIQRAARTAAQRENKLAANALQEAAQDTTALAQAAGAATAV